MRSAACEAGGNRVSSKPSRILIVDDHPIVRFALAEIMNRQHDLVVCGEASDAAGALSALPECQPQIVLVDISLGDSNGIELTRTIRSQNAELPVLVLSMHDEVVYAERALRAGANGYVMKHEDPETILSAIRSVLADGRYLSERMIDRLSNTAPHVLETVGYRSVADCQSNG
jgi:DNA-binding NarL/FixJ family response regulator